MIMKSMTGAEIYSIVCEMLLDYLKHPYTMDGVHMHVYAACAFYPQESEWFKEHGIVQNVIQCVP